MDNYDKNEFFHNIELEFLKELENLEEEEIEGSGPIGTMISILGGNRGHICTLTVECMPSCN